MSVSPRETVTERSDEVTLTEHSAYSAIYTASRNLRCVEDSPRRKGDVTCAVNVHIHEYQETVLGHKYNYYYYRYVNTKTCVRQSGVHCACLFGC
jgi:hypothetical protein